MLVGAYQFRTHFPVANLPKPIASSTAIRNAPLSAIFRKSSSLGYAAPSTAETTIFAPHRDEGEGEVQGEGKRDGYADRDGLLLPLGLQREALPKHVAVIMDGNGRWAAARGLPASAGHEAGYRTLQLMVQLSCKWGIRVLTVFAFSSENCLRPKPEVNFLMMLFEKVLKENLADFMREGIRTRIIGDSSKLPKSLQNVATELEEMTEKNSRLDLIVAISYSGRNDIVRACQKIAQKVKNGLLKPEDITESWVTQELETSAVCYPDPDLLIRTSGELRLSNFLLWELAYTELYFAQSYWPDFGEDEYAEALRAFQRRQRRFGLRNNS